MAYRSFFMLVLLFCTTLIHTAISQIPRKGDSITPWKDGYLDLHHINTGRGNAAYYIFPDGTTMLFDLGEQDPTDERTHSARNTVIRPNNSKKPYEWVAHYIQQA